MVEYELYEPKHYPTLVKMWENHGWNIPPEDFLPRTGIVAFYNDVPIGACFVYLTNSKSALLEWLVTDSSVDVSIRRPIVLPLIESMVLLAKNKGYKYVHTFTSNTKLIDTHYKEVGFKKQGKGDAQGLMLVLGGEK